MGGIRLLARVWAEVRLRQVVTDAPRRHVRVLLVGAGSAGSRMGREIRHDPAARMELAGFLDDDPAKVPLTIAGTRVLGAIGDLPRVAHDYLIDEILITMPSAAGEATRRVVELARKAGVDCRILPGITQVLSGDAQLAGVRRVEVDDLLRREPVELELSTDYIAGHTVLVTGAGGSIGSELVRELGHLGPGTLVLFGHGENSLHKIQQELVTSMPELDFTVVVGDIRDRAKLTHVMGKYQPDVVFHAAAHKHVPMMESDPDEAVLNNVAGTRNLAEAALVAGVRRFVNISTDKAVNPASMLGITKSLAGALGPHGGGPGRSRSGLRIRPVRERPGQPRFGRAHLRGADPTRWPPHHHEPRCGPLLHDDPGGLPPGDPGWRSSRQQRRVHTEHGHTGRRSSTWQGT